METRKRGAHARGRASGSLIAGAIAVLLAACVLVFSIVVTSSIPPTSAAVGAATTTVQGVAVDEATQPEVASQIVAAGSTLVAGTGEAAGEVISDDETPLAAGPLSNPLDGFVWLLLACIAGAVAFFLVSTRRLNADIAHMKRTIG